MGGAYAHSATGLLRSRLAITWTPTPVPQPGGVRHLPRQSLITKDNSSSVKAVPHKLTSCGGSDAHTTRATAGRTQHSTRPPYVMLRVE